MKLYLEENLLKSNTKLKTFDISSNRIYAIHPTVFESLQKLLYFNIRDNICSSLIYENSTIIKNGMNNLKLNCSSDLHSVLSQNYKIIEELGRKNSELLQKLNYLKSKMVSLEIIVILALGCIVVALVIYIIHKNCRNSSNQRFHSKVSDKTDMFEETSSICFSSTAGGLDDFPMRRAASHLNINHQKQSAYAEDGLPEYADPIMFTQEDIERRLNSSGQNYLNSEVNPSSNYLNCGPFGDNAVIKYQNYPLEQSTENLGLKSTLNIQDVGNKKRIVRQNSNQHGNLPKGSFPSGSIGHAQNDTIYANSFQNVIPKPSENLIPSPSTTSHSNYNLSSTKHPESSNNSSTYDSSTQRSVKTAEIGKMTVKYTNISRAPSQTENVSSGLPQLSNIQSYSTQSSISGMDSLRRPKNIPNLQKPKFFDNIHQKLQVVSPIDNKSFEFPDPKSSGHGQKGRKASESPMIQSKSPGSAGIHLKTPEHTNINSKSPLYTNMNQNAFNFDRNGQMSSNLSESNQKASNFPDVIQDNSKTGTLKASTTFSLNLPQNDQKSPSNKSTKSLIYENAPNLPTRNNPNLSKTLENRESIDVDYCEPLVDLNELQLYTEPYDPSKK